MAIPDAQKLLQVSLPITCQVVSRSGLLHIHSLAALAPVHN